MTKDVMKWTRKELLSLPVKCWQKVGVYSAVMLVPTYEKHDSGWRLIALVGCDERFNPIEIAGYCDDVNLCTNYSLKFCDVHSDIVPSTNIVRLHSNSKKFKIADCCSSTEIWIE